MFAFSPLAALAGGALIGLAASALWIANRRIAGISGIIGGMLSPVRGDIAWRALFLKGLIGVGLLMSLAYPAAFTVEIQHSFVLTAVAGLLVGFGTRMANGCTSGHGVCGVSRLSPRSLAATATFVGAGIVTTFVANHLVGGRL